MKIQNKILPIIIAIFAIISCEKKVSEMSDLEKLRTSTNRKTYPVTKKDSAQAIQSITKQKLQEIFDLSTLYTSGNRDTKIDSVIYAQMSNYFEKPDSTKLKPILNLSDSLKAKSAKVGEISVFKKITKKDTLDFAKFNVEFFDNKSQSLGKFEKNAQYILKSSPVKFKNEFKFYFVDFPSKSPNDSISVGKTK